MIINHNMAALNTYNKLHTNTNSTARSLEKLSSGLRINKAGDDAAGLAISEKMRAQIRGLDQATRNAQDGISLIQTAEGSLSETHSILQRMRELATQAANDTNTTSDRAEIQKEVNQLTSEINRIGNTSEFNTIKLLSGELNVKAAQTAKVTGAQVTGNIDIISTSTNASATGSAITTAEISALGGASATGDVAYNATAANGGPKVELTNATSTGTDLENANISALAGTTVYGSKAYTVPDVADNGPKVEKTAATVTGAAALGAAVAISNINGVQLTGTSIYATPTNVDSGPTVARTDDAISTGDAITNRTVEIRNKAYSTATTTKQHDTTDITTAQFEVVAPGSNELTFTYNGATSTINVDDTLLFGGAGGLEIFRAELETKLQAVSTNISVAIDNGYIQIRTRETDTLTLDGGGLLTDHLNANPADIADYGTIAANNVLTLNINGESKEIILDTALGTDVYDLTVAGGGPGADDQDDFLTMINGKLDAVFGAGNVVAAFTAADKLTFEVVGTSVARSTIESIQGSAAATLGYSGAEVITQGAGNEISMTLNGTTKTIYLDLINYAAGGDDGATEFAKNVQDKIRALGGGFANVTVGFDAADKITIRSGNPTDAFTINKAAGDGTQYLLAAPANNFASAALYANNKLNLTVNNITQEITLANGVYDLTAPGAVGGPLDQADFLADLNGKLNGAFGIGNIVASFTGDDELVLTNALTGENSTLTVNGGSAVDASPAHTDTLKLAGKSDVGNDYTTLTLTYNGVQQTINLDEVNYSAGGNDSAEDFAQNIEDKIQALGVVNGQDFANISVTINGAGNVEFTTTGVGDSLNIDAGGAMKFLVNDVDEPDFTTLAIGTGNNQLNLKVNEVAGTITLADGNFDLTKAADKQTLLADLNAKLAVEFGVDKVTASMGGESAGAVDSVSVAKNSVAEGRGVYTVEITNALTNAADNTITVGGVEFEIGNGKDIDTSVDTTAQLQAEALKGLIEGDIGLAAKYDVVRVGGKLTLTEKAGQATGEDLVVTTALTGNAGAISSATVENSVDEVLGEYRFRIREMFQAGDQITIDNVTFHAVAAGADRNANEFNISTHLEAQLDDLILTVNTGGSGLDTRFAATKRLDDTLVLTEIAGQATGADLTNAVTAGNSIVFTNNLAGKESTIEVTGGSAASFLNLADAVNVQGTENNELTLTLNSNTQTIALDVADYSSGDKTAQEFLNDLNAKLEGAFGAGTITASFNGQNQITFTTANVGDSLSIDGGGAVSHLVASNDASDFTIAVDGSDNNKLNITAGGLTKEITLANGNYDFSLSADRDTFLADMNTKLDAAFGDGNITAAFDGNNKLVLTNNLTGSVSTLTAVTGTAQAELGLDTAAYVQGANANNTSIMNIDGIEATITLNAGTYTMGGLATDLQTQIRAVAGLENATVNYTDGAFVITSGNNGAAGSVSVTADELAKTLGLDNATVTAGIGSVDQGIRLQVGANFNQSMTVDIADMRGVALKVSGNASQVGAEVVASDGAQAKYVSVANVSDGTDNTNTEYALDVSSFESATAAISVINDAIAAVSSERAKLGAFQNRLDHTINNLGTSSENLTSAESRIRDVDMAKEMMEFTKNNILSQAAQAMLAQANQQTQGVLQLLR